MDFFKKVFAEANPAIEEVEEEKAEDEKFPFVEGPPPDDDRCACFCFCEDKGDGSDPEEEEEEDLVDPQDELKETCAEQKSCQAYKAKLDECNARVESKSKTSETCVEEIIDFMHCVDHCVSKTLFTKLK